MRRKLLIGVLVALGQLGVSGFAAESGANAGAVSREDRQARAERHVQIAEMHKKMAECLRSDKALGECQEQMRKDCPMVENGGHCQMMEGSRGMGKGHGRGRMDKKEGS